MNKRKVAVCLFGLSLLILIVYLFIPPTPETRDDTFAAYMLGNGFPLATLKLTYFDDGFLFYEKLFAWLYLHFQGINWLTLFYLLIHLISGTIICSLMICRRSHILTIFPVLVYLFLFFIPLITQLSYTSVAAHGIIAGFYLSYVQIRQGKRPSPGILLLLFMVFVSCAGLRVQVIFPLGLIFMPILFLIRNSETFKRWILLFSLVAGGLLVGVMIHERNYERNIPGWGKIKSTSHLFYMLQNYGYDTSLIRNQSTAFKRIAYAAVENNFLFDDTIMDPHVLEQMKRDTKIETRLNMPALAWVLTDIKQYLVLLFTGFILLMLTDLPGKTKKVILLSGVITFSLLAFFLFRMKLPGRIWLPSFLLLFLLVYHPLPEGMIVARKLRNKLIMLSAVFLIPMQAVAIFTLAKENKLNTSLFLKAYQVIQKNPDTLFLEYRGSFPFNYFPLLHSPASYPFSNVLFPLFLNTELRSRTLQKFGITGISDGLVHSKNIILIGDPDPFLQNYFLLIYHQKIQFTRVNDNKSGIHLFRLSILP